MFYQLAPSYAGFLTQFSGTFTKLWNITGTRIHIKARGGEPWAEGSMIPGSNYSAQDDHAGIQVPGL